MAANLKSSNLKSSFKSSKGTNTLPARKRILFLLSNLLRYRNCPCISVPFILFFTGESKLDKPHQYGYPATMATFFVARLIWVDGLKGVYGITNLLRSRYLGGALRDDSNNS